MSVEPIKLLIPLMPPPEKILPWLEKIHVNRHYTNFGPLTRQLESQLSDFFPITPDSSLTTLSNATQGIELAIDALNLPPGSRILLPALTFSATATAIVRCGHIPLFADIDPASWLMTTSIASEAAKTQEYAAAIPVAAFGTQQDSQAWATFAKKNGKPVIIDAAGAFGNQQCSDQYMTIFSLHATKSLGCGEGGLAVGPTEWVKRIRTASNFGIGPAPGIEHSGTNAKMSEFHAAVALAALEQWSANKALRHTLHRRYLERLRVDCEPLITQERATSGVYTILPVLLPHEKSPTQLSTELAAQGIDSRRWYHPLLIDQPAFVHAPCTDSLPVARNISARLIGLPFHPFLTADDIARICKTVADCLK